MRNLKRREELTRINKQLKEKGRNIIFTNESGDLVMQNNGTNFYMPVVYNKDGGYPDLITEQYKLPIIDNIIDYDKDFESIMTIVSNKIAHQHKFLLKETEYYYDISEPKRRLDLPLQYADLLVDNLIACMQNYDKFPYNLDREKIRQYIIDTYFIS